MLTLTLTLFLAAEPVSPPPPCSAVDGRVEPVAPSPGEIDVPLDAKLWLRHSGTATLSVVVRDLDDTRDLPNDVQSLFSVLGREGAVVVELRERLVAGHSYAVSWTPSVDGEGGYTFTAGSTIAQGVPSPPTAVDVQAFNARPQCAVSTGLQLRVQGTGPALLLASVAGALSGLGRDGDVFATVGRADVSVNGTVVAVDLAGHRSDAFRYSGVTQPVQTLEEDGGCQCVRRGARDGVPWALLSGLSLALLSRRRVLTPS